MIRVDVGYLQLADISIGHQWGFLKIDWNVLSSDIWWIIHNICNKTFLIHVTVQTRSCYTSKRINVRSVFISEKKDLNPNVDDCFRYLVERRKHVQREGVLRTLATSTFVVNYSTWLTSNCCTESWRCMVSMNSKMMCFSTTRLHFVRNQRN